MSPLALVVPTKTATSLTDRNQSTFFISFWEARGKMACSCKKMKALRNWTYVSPADLIVPRATFHNSIFSRYIVKKKNEIETLGFLYGRFRSRST